MNNKKAVLYVNISVLLFGTAGLFAKFTDMPAIGITFGRVFFSSMALLIFMLLKREGIRLKCMKDIIPFAFAGVVLAFHWWSFLEAIKLSTVAVGTITFSSFPLFVTFFEPLILREGFKAENVCLSLLILIGVLVTVPEFSFENSMARGIGVGMLSALAYSILTIFNKVFSKKYDGTLIAFYEQGIAAAVLFPCVLRADIVPKANDIVLLVFMGVFATAFAHTLFIKSLKNLSAQLAGLCSSMETVYGIILAFLVLGERPGIRECLGAFIIVGSVIYAQIRSENKQQV